MFHLSDRDREELRQQVEEHVRRQKIAGRTIFAVMTTLMFIIFLIVSLVVIGSSQPLQIAFGDEASGAFLVTFLPFLGFGLAVLFQWISLLFDSKGAEKQIRERLLSRALATMLLDQQQETEKPKRSLSDIGVDSEGELVDLNTQVQDDLPMRRVSRDQ
jgi:hypothetical protein